MTAINASPTVTIIVPAARSILECLAAMSRFYRRPGSGYGLPVAGLASGHAALIVGQSLTKRSFTPEIIIASKILNPAHPNLVLVTRLVRSWQRPCRRVPGSAVLFVLSVC